MQEYHEHVTPPVGLGLVLLGDLTVLFDTPEDNGDAFWANQENWEILRWKLNESCGIHTLELENGVMIHMQVERLYPLRANTMTRMLDHGLQVFVESQNALYFIQLMLMRVYIRQMEEEDQ